MRKKLTALLLALTLLSALLPAVPAAADIGTHQTSGSEERKAASAENIASPVTVSDAEILYAYDGMTVYNNGGTVYSTGATVYNNGGTVFCSGGIVYNNGGMVYALSGLVYCNGGTVYNSEAELRTAPEMADENRIFGYYELKFGGYYEPYMTYEGIVTEPGAERMIISEDSVCRITPRDGWRIVKAESDVGTVSREEDGSVILRDVDGDTVLRLSFEDT